LECPWLRKIASWLSRLWQTTKPRRPQYELVMASFIQSKRQFKKKYWMLLLYNLVSSVVEKKRTWCGELFDNICCKWQNENAVVAQLFYLVSKCLFFCL
jgi:hypothetical protein